MKKLPFATGASISVVLAVAAAAASLMGSCSSDKKDESDLRGLCSQGCLKTKDCLGSLAGSLDCTAECNKPTVTNPTTCANTAAITAKYKECIAKPVCAEFTACAETIPACQTTGGVTGAGGSTTPVPPGTGGMGGGGSGVPGFGGIPGGIGLPDGGIVIPGFDAGIFDAGGASCAECAKAQMCAGAAAGGNNVEAQCNAAMGQQREAFIIACRFAISIVPACQ